METITNFFKEEEDFLFRRGEIKGRLNVARQMKKVGLSMAQIVKFTGLREKEIRKL